MFLAAVIGIATHRLIGWSINTHMRTSLVIDALNAPVARGGHVNDVIFRSDRGNTAVVTSPTPADGTASAAR